MTRITHRPASPPAPTRRPAGAWGRRARATLTLGSALPVKLTSGALPVKLTVHPFTLDKADDVTISCTGTTGGHWRVYADLNERWWKAAHPQHDEPESDKDATGSMVGAESHGNLFS